MPVKPDLIRKAKQCYILLTFAVRPAIDTELSMYNLMTICRCFMPQKMVQQLLLEKRNTVKMLLSSVVRPGLTESIRKAKRSLKVARLRGQTWSDRGHLKIETQLKCCSPPQSDLFWLAAFEKRNAINCCSLPRSDLVGPGVSLNQNMFNFYFSSPCGQTFSDS